MVRRLRARSRSRASDGRLSRGRPVRRHVGGRPRRDECGARVRREHRDGHGQRVDVAGRDEEAVALVRHVVRIPPPASRSPATRRTLPRAGRAAHPPAARGGTAPGPRHSTRRARARPSRPRTRRRRRRRTAPRRRGGHAPRRRTPPGRRSEASPLVPRSRAWASAAISSAALALTVAADEEKAQRSAPPRWARGRSGRCESDSGSSRPRFRSARGPARRSARGLPNGRRDGRERAGRGSARASLRDYVDMAEHHMPPGLEDGRKSRSRASPVAVCDTE